MKTATMVMLMMVLACSMSAMAQTSDASGTMMHKDKPMSMMGCVSQKDGKFMMMNKMYPDGIMMTSSEDMTAHVGHKMKVTGMMENMSGDAMKSTDKMGDMQMKVTSMKMISATCDVASMTSK